MTKARLRFSKSGKIRFISHRDVARVFERAIRKLQLPVAYSQGFSPRPKISFGLALSVGHESDAEYLDIEFSAEVDLETLAENFNACLPEGVSVTAVQALEPKAKSLQQVISSCVWLIELLNVSSDYVDLKIDELIAAETLPISRERKGKTTVVDVRPALLEINIAGVTDNGVEINAHLATKPVTIRPSEFVSLFGSGTAEGRVRRKKQWMSADGASCEPIGLPASSAEGHREMSAL